MQSNRYGNLVATDLWWCDVGMGASGVLYRNNEDQSKITKKKLEKIYANFENKAFEAGFKFDADIVSDETDIQNGGFSLEDL